MQVVEVHVEVDVVFLERAEVEQEVFVVHAADACLRVEHRHALQTRRLYDGLRLRCSALPDETGRRGGILLDLVSLQVDATHLQQEQRYL
jgi:hypothetical protein